MKPRDGKIGQWSATALVVANMIGTGAFTTLGLQLNWIDNGTTLMLLWLVGGVVALCGAVSYAELGTRMPKSGGEAHYLSKIYHPLLGFLSGWVSLTVGFAAAVALSAMAVGHYLESLIGWSPVYTATASIVLLSLAHSLGTHGSSRLQNLLTAIKFVLVLGLGLAGVFLPAQPVEPIAWIAPTVGNLWSGGAAIALISVLYAYSGWNAAAYIVEDIRQPNKNLPRALIGGTLLVTCLFLLLQYSFLHQAGGTALKGEIEVAKVAAELMLGKGLGSLISVTIGILLLTGISAMIWVGPRVVRAMGDEHQLWRSFSKLNSRGVPLRATWLQGFISLFLVVTASFERVLLYSEFVLQVFTFLAVAGLVWVRLRKTPQGGYRSPLFPLPQLIFLGFTGWSITYLLVHNPVESLLGTLNVATGYLAYRMQ